MYALNVYDLLTNSLYRTILIDQGSFVCTQLNGFKYCYLTLIVVFALS